MLLKCHRPTFAAHPRPPPPDSGSFLGARSSSAGSAPGGFVSTLLPGRPAAAVADVKRVAGRRGVRVAQHPSAPVAQEAGFGLRVGFRMRLARGYLRWVERDFQGLGANSFTSVTLSGRNRWRAAHACPCRARLSPTAEPRSQGCVCELTRSLLTQPAVVLQLPLHLPVKLPFVIVVV